MTGTETRHIYFLGIGGIGMSALAHYFLREGKQVSGYDRASSVVTEALEAAGATVYLSENTAHLEGQDLVVYTPAIPAESIEFQAAQSMGIPLKKRSVVLGEISRKLRTLAIGGTHGKTTTSTMLAHLLRASGVDATAFLGGISRNLNGNFVWGTSDWAVVEADEFDRSFLQLSPEIAVITSTDADHLDIYETSEAVEAGYLAFAGQSKSAWVQVALADLKWPVAVRTFGIDAGDAQATHLQTKGLTTTFDWECGSILLEGLKLAAPGDHNVLNMTAALALAVEAGANPEMLPTAVATYRGIYRRFEVHVDTPLLSYIDDYAHHPTEIAAALQATRAAFPERQIVVVFQPHLYSRTRDFAAGFSAELAKADAVLLLDLYPAREKPIAGVSAALLLKGINDIPAALVTRQALTETLTQWVKLPSVVLTLGAGDIDQEIGQVKEWAVHRAGPLSLAGGTQKPEKP